VGLDLSEITEWALRRRLGRPKPSSEAAEAERIETWRREHADALACRNEVIDREGFFGQEWRTS
jgi:post-segregation antitoxin (ccd killing protein)